MCWMAHWRSGSRVGPRSRSRRGTRSSSRRGGHTKPPMKERPLPRFSPPIWWRRVSLSPRPSRTEVSTHSSSTRGGRLFEREGLVCVHQLVMIVAVVMVVDMGVIVLEGSGRMRVHVRLGSFPTLMFVLVVLVMDVAVGVHPRLVPMPVRVPLA